MADHANMALNDPGGTTVSQNVLHRRNLTKIDDHDHTTGKGVTIGPAVLAAILADGTSGDFADYVKAALAVTPADAVFADIVGVDITIGATNSKVPFATTTDENPVNQHFESAANLTGTVSKVASSAAVVGVGTAFTTELTVGQLISIPGTAAETFAVTVITDNTHLTLSAVAANSASGQTAARLNNGLVCRKAGRYAGIFSAGFTAVSSGTRTLEVLVNDAVGPHAKMVYTVGAVSLAGQVAFVANLSQWDVVQPRIASTEASSPFTTPRFSWTYLGATS